MLNEPRGQNDVPATPLPKDAPSPGYYALQCILDGKIIDKTRIRVFNIEVIWGINVCANVHVCV
jgi:hypothetical protein